MRGLVLGIFLLLAIISCDKKGESISKDCIVVNDQDEEQFYWFDKSSKDVYNFHKNKKLQYYVFREHSKMNGAAVYFYENGSVEEIANFSSGKKEGIDHWFYPSGNLKRVNHYENDSLRGYFIEYYDKYNLKKAEYMASPHSKNGYIYKRGYDSSSQKVIEITDHRPIEIEEYPNTNPESLKMPWE
jgi:antitoxin component YwqK of YwqJK toxin-antitoxin module